MAEGSGKRAWSWEIFVGFMFIGLGIGLLLGEPGAGILLGMGLGFILASFIAIEDNRVSLSIPNPIVGSVFIVLGIVFILMGLEVSGVIILEIMKYAGGLIIVLLGIIFLLGGFKMFSRR